MSLTVRDLTKKYGEKTVLDHLSFEMPTGGVYALLGTNGAGKTTAIRMMLGMLSRDEGEVLWNGKPFDTSVCNVGYLAEERGLYPKYALMDQLIYFAGLRGVSRSDARQRIRYWADRLEVGEYLYPAPASAPALGQPRSPRRVKTVPPKKADQLSKGNQQKIQLMTALISDPELLILDEPLSGVDVEGMETLMDMLDEIRRSYDLSILMTTHDFSMLPRYADQVVLIDHGIKIKGSPEAVLNSTEFSDAFHLKGGKP